MYKDYYMTMALSSAKKAMKNDEVPVGAIIVMNDIVIARGYNKKEKYQDPTLHAEIDVIKKATRLLKTWNLSGADVYVTLEPCLMCTGALIAARIRRLFFGAWDSKYGCCGSLLNVSKDVRFNHQFEIEGGIMEIECQKLLTDFFKEKREAHKCLL
ncbi:MAG: tRNA adenosine(34) deaminase TadA [Christensenellaceae bacterium]|jgi:tRNA(adenine34) deaminase|nr:tRNA adenosine(34) deaminase TadA [Christensenellaceae bacterium]